MTYARLAAEERLGFPTVNVRAEFFSPFVYGDEVEADEVGASLRNASAKITRAARSSEGKGGGQHQAEADPWASDKAGGYSDEPPF